MTTEAAKVNQQPIPEVALRDKDAVEMLRVWIAERRLHCSIRIGMYHEAKNAPEEKAWGTILADVARHVAHALETEYSANGARVLAMIRESFLDELDAPTSEAEGSFVRKH